MLDLIPMSLFRLYRPTRQVAQPTLRPSSIVLRPLRVMVLSIVALHAAGALADQSQIERGQAIYVAQCANCHGSDGQGTADSYPEALAGDWPQVKLTEVIADTMPEDDPDACVGEDAAAVAAYVYDAFYSPTAQMRNAPPRYQLSRLTASQYRHSVADLVQMFRGDASSSPERGVQSETFQSDRLDRKERKIEQVQPRIDLDFGTGSPIEGQKDGEAFSLRMRGSLLAPDTGTYQISLRTPNAAVLWFNDEDAPLIDAKIKSGDRNDYTASVFLLAGRAYTVRLEYFRADFGSKKVGNTGHETASLQLRWRRPGRVDEVIPERYLSPSSSPRQWTVATPFPPDDSSVGYARGTSVSQAWDEATTDAALETGVHLVDNLNRIAGTKDDAEDREQKIRRVCERFVERALRGPLNDAQRAQYIDRHFEEADSLESAVRRVVLVTLKSPRFLYPELPAESPAADTSLEAYQVAHRLALGMWDSVPDDSLIELAAQNQLSSPEQIMAAAARMADDPRTRAKLRAFLHHWLHLSDSGELSKDPEAYPNFTPEIVSDLRESLDLFLEDVLWSEGSDYRQLLSANRIYVNAPLAAFYDLPASDVDDQNFQSVDLPHERSAGVLTHPALMAGFSYSRTTSPIHRGVFLARNVLGRTLRPPPVAVSPLSPELHAELSTRERVALQTEPAACASCHEMINPLGFAFEQFDAVGRFRSEEQGQPIDVSGEYLTRGGEQVSFVGVRPLAEFLVGSQETHESFVRQLFEHVTKQPIAAYGPDRSAEITKQFTESDFNVRELLIAIAVVYAQGPRDHDSPLSLQRDPQT